MIEADDTATLVAILAEVDALFFPVRKRVGNLSANTLIGRHNYPESGLRFHAGGGDAAGRKSAERRLAALAAANLITTFRSRGRVSRVALTAAGEAEARNVAGLPLADESLEALEEIAKRTKREPVLFQDYWIGEDVLTGHRWGDADTKPLARFEMVMLPALLRGWAVSGSTVHGHVYYAITPAGWEALDHPPEFYIPTLPFDESAAPAYYAAVREAESRLITQETEWVGEIGECPLQVSNHNCRLKPRVVEAESPEVTP